MAEKLSSSLDELKDESIIKRMNKALSIINRFDVDKTSDLIEVTISFNNGLLRNSKSRFVILDTPGSNSASNVAHLTVLDEAMKGLTNGLPMFVSKYDSLDSFDNKELYDKIKSMKELDSRFTMIVVNKADENNLPVVERYTKEKQNEIMSQLVPKNLYSEGIFFVSSILGLGSKTNGQFLDKHSNRVFRTMKFLFEDPEDEDYMTLYAYDIMPEQLKTKFMNDCQNSKEDLIFVNSGLYAIEREIQTFADKYAVYNKCQQSTLYLNHIIDLTSTEIEETIEKREQTKQELIDSLEEEKQELLIKLDNRSDELEQVFELSHTQDITAYIEKSKPKFTQEEIKEYEIAFKSQQEENLQYDKREDDVKKSFDSIKKNLSKNVDYAINKLDKESFKKAGKAFVDDVKEAYENMEERNDTRKEVDRIVADKLFELAMNE